MKTTTFPKTHQQLRGILIQRLFLGAMLVSVLAGSLAYWVESQRVEGRTIEHAFEGLRHFKSPSMQGAASLKEGDHSGIRQLMNEEFVGIRFFTPGAKMLLDVWQPRSELWQEVVERHSPQLIPAGQTSARISIEDNEVIIVVLPMITNEGHLSGYVEGISLISSSALQEMRLQIRWAALTASVSVLIAILMLYPLMSGLLGRTVALSSRLLEANLSLLESLGNAIAKRDADTNSHNYRVTCYAVTLAEAVGIGGETIAELVLGAFLHDVGKIGIPDNILLKPEKLTSEEFQIMQTHTLLGIDIVASNPWLTGAEKIIRHHHERFDGKGYPDGLVGKEIPVSARIFAVVDVFDALTSARPYKKAFSLEETMRIMELEAGKHFDPAIYAVFQQIAPKLYEQRQSRGDAQWSSELKAILKCYFTIGSELG